MNTWPGMLGHVLSYVMVNMDLRLERFVVALVSYRDRLCRCVHVYVYMFLNTNKLTYV